MNKSLAMMKNLQSISLEGKDNSFLIKKIIKYNQNSSNQKETIWLNPGKNQKSFF